MGPRNFRNLRRLAPGVARALRCAAAIAVLSGGTAHAQGRDSEQAQTAAIITTPGSIVKVTDMGFGKIFASGAGGTVTLTAAPSPTCTAAGGVTHTGTCRSARFTIQGRRNWTVRLRTTGGSGPIILTGPAGATMTLNSITLTPVGMTSKNGGNGWNLGTYTINSSSGIADFYLGGRLNVNAQQRPGLYRGTINVQVQFN